VAEALPGPLLVLAPALGQSRRTLLEAGRKSAAQDLVLASALAEGLRTYHTQLAQQVTSPALFRETRSLLSNLFEELSDLLKGLYLLAGLDQRGEEILGSYGERAAAIIIAHVLRSRGVESSCFSSHEVFVETSGLREEIDALIARGAVPVLPESLRAVLG
jgi:aspartokinase